jgi:hypothetical protein
MVNIVNLKYNQKIIDSTLYNYLFLKRCFMKRSILFCFALIFASITLSAQPSSFTYQGKILNSVGAPITQSNVELKFSIYDDPSAGNKIWPSAGEVTKTLDIVDGLYSVILGDGSNGNEAFTGNMLSAATPYIQVTVNGSVLPRTAMTSTPYSLVSSSLTANAWNNPGEIGKTTPNTGAFSNLSVGTGTDKYSLPANRGNNNQVLTTNGAGLTSWANAAAGGSGLSSFAYVFELATLADATVVGGADVPFSNNGPMLNTNHTASMTTISVTEAGVYKIDYGVNMTAGVGSAISIAINGTVDASTNISALVATGHISGSAMLTLVAGDVITLRNNSATPMTLTLAPSLGSYLTITKID